MKRKKVALAEPTVVEPVTPMPRRPAGNRFVRWAGNLWIIFHFTAVLAAAGSVGPTSGLILAVWKPVRPYLQFLCLNYGYDFYAPEPAPSTLLSYEIERGDGTSIRGQVHDPSLRPRLLYHRHLLLTEHLGVATPELQHYWYKSYARHLCHKYGGSRVRLTRLIHYPATMEMIRSGASLNEPFSYEETFVGDFSCSDF